MAKITIGNGKPVKWQKYATIEVSKREAALLATIMSKCNGKHKFAMEIYQEFIDLICDCDVPTVDLHSQDVLYSHLDNIGEE